LLGAGLLSVLEDVGLLLESALALDGQFGSHVCGEQSWRIGWRLKCCRASIATIT
jgi:hypothetical protein